jgi:UDP-glucuronate decarboxylase
MDDGRVVPNFVTQALQGQDLTVYGDGSQTRSFCYVADLVDGLQELMETNGLGGEVINLGRPEEATILQLAELTQELCDTDSEITHEPLPQDDPSRRKPDISRAIDLLDWEPEITLRDGLRRTIDSFDERLGDA